MTDFFEFEADFSKTTAEAKALMQALARDSAIAKEVGDTLLQGKLEMAAALSQGTLAGGTGQAEVQAANQTIERQNALKQLGREIDISTLDALKLQTTQLAEQAALTERLQRSTAASEAGGIIVPRERRYTSYGQTAGAQVSAQLAEEAAARQRVLQYELEQLAAEQARLTTMKEERNLLAFQTGQQAGAAGRLVPTPVRESLQQSVPAGMTAKEWTAADQALVRYNTALGENAGLNSRASTTTAALTANMTRLGLADAEVSNQLRKNGALTTEYLGALARGETTVAEFGYQIGATIGKFAGWTAAAAATYGALGAVFEFGKGAIDTASAVQRLTRTIDGLDRQKASTGLQNLSADVNVPLKEAGDAVFQFSRTFGNLDDSLTAAKLSLAAFKLDGVAVGDSVKAVTAIHQQFGLTAQGLIPIFDELAQGQQKFNARISDQIPLLQKSASAVKNAGGNLQDFITISTIFLRTTQLSGSQGGTAFARSAANFLSPNTSKGQADRAVLESLGIDPNRSYTDVIFQALKRSTTLTPNQRAQLSLAIFGPQLGARTAGLFTGGPALLAQAQKELSPEGSKGVLQIELNKELGTAKEKLHSFVNELQRMGAALADSGVVDVFTSLISVFKLVVEPIRQAINTFDGLPKVAKDLIEVATALRLLSLFTSRTRFGGSIPLVSSIPGFRASEGTRARQDIALGSRKALENLDNTLIQTTARANTAAERMLILKQQQVELERAAGGPGKGTVQQIEEQNKILAQIASLERQQARIESERNAQIAIKARYTSQYNAASATRFSGQQMSDAEAIALQRQLTGPTTAAQGAGAATAAATAAKQRLVAAETRLAALLRTQGVADAEMAVAMNEVTAASAAVAAEEAVLATETAASVGVMARFRAGATGFLAGLDPLLVGMIALPLLYGEISGTLDKQSKALDATRKATAQVITSMADLQSKAAALAAAGKTDRSTADPGGLSGFISHVQVGLGTILGGGAGKALTQPFTKASQAGINANDQAAALQAIFDAYTHEANRFQKDGESLVKTAAGRAQMAQQAKTLQARMSALAGEVFTGTLDPKTLKQANDALGKQLKGISDALIAAQAGKSGAADFQSLILSGALKSTDIEKQLQALDDYAQIYGTTNDALKKAALGYAALAQRYARPGASDQDLQAVKTAQANFINAVNKNVQDLLKASQSGATFRVEAGDLSAALGVIEQAKAAEENALKAIIAKDKGNADAIAKAKQAADQIFAQLNDQLKTVLDAQLALIKTRTDLQVSQVSGSSPETDITRSQTELNGLNQELAQAQKDGASYAVITGLQTQINSKSNALVKQRLDNARGILDAQGALNVAKIQGNSPQADIARARADVSKAQSILSFDQAHGAGQKQILADQAALDTALNTLNTTAQTQAQALHQSLAAFIQSQATLAQSQTLDPVLQAQEQVAADIKELALIQRKDYKSQTDFLTAQNDAKAKLNKDRQGVQNAIVQQDLGTLKFELDTGKIGDQQYIDGLQQILATKKLSLQERQQIEQQIYSLQQGLGKNLDLNVGNIKLPSVYEIRRAIGLGQNGQLPGAQNTIINHTATVAVYVYGEKGAAAVGKVLDDHLNTTVKAAMRAKGVI